MAENIFDGEIIEKFKKDPHGLGKKSLLSKENVVQKAEREYLEALKGLIDKPEPLLEQSCSPIADVSGVRIVKKNGEQETIADEQKDFLKTFGKSVF